jgi:methylated-DNA-[protein]-cysteine S-methyltransferase
MAPHLSEKTLHDIILNNHDIENKIYYFYHWKNCAECTGKLIHCFFHNYLESNPSVKRYYYDLNNDISVRIITDETSLIEIKISDPMPILQAISPKTTPLIKKIADTLNHYLAGKDIKNINITSLNFHHISDFARKIYLLTYLIPFGHIMTYGEIAKLSGSSGAAQAVGQALKRNPFPLIVPCHRVLGKNNQLTGFAGGLALKEKLLHLEQPQNSI